MSLEALKQEIARAQNLVVITGAGISAESGISTFRGAGGYWNRFRADELASPEGFQRDPELVWRWYTERREALLKAEPNPGHDALVQLEQRVPNFTLITQNVDGLHQRAGSQNVVTLHGSIWELRCMRSGKAWDSDEIHTQFPVRCRCGALARPGVLWFGESYDAQTIQAASSALEAADVVLTIGTSGMVWIVAGLLQYAQSAHLAEFNLERTDLSAQMDTVISGPSGKTLPQLL